jgi:hypothetical protein
VTASLKYYTNAVVARFIADGTLHLIRLSSDSQRGFSSIGEYLPASFETKKALNKKLREPKKLVLYKHGLYECTMNDPWGCYNQSSLALLLELPQGHTLQSFLPITIWNAPAGTTDLDFMSIHNGQPTPDQLKDWE